MTRLRPYVMALGVLLVVMPSAARADPSPRFDAVITPSAVLPPGSGTYTISIVNKPNSLGANEAHIAIPFGLIVDGFINPPHATIVSGPCAGPTWPVTLGVTSLDLTAPDSLAVLCEQATLDVTFSVLVGPVTEGQYTWTTQLSGDGVDFAALSQPVLIVDATAPETTIDSHPSNPSPLDTASFAFSGDDGAGSGIASFECDLDGAGFLPCPNPTAYGGLADGSHTFQVRAIDMLDHIDASPASFSWIIDTVNPVVTIGSGPSSLTNQTTASFTFSSSKPSSTYECKLDGADFTQCSSPRLYTGLDDGSHVFTVRATAITTGPPTTYGWTVDTVPPETTIASGPPSASNSASANFIFTSGEVGSTFACSLDASGITPCVSPISYSGLGDGAHTFRVEAVDAAGNADATPATYSWQITGVGPATIDRTPPGNVKRLKRNVGYRSLKLSWSRPSDSDFDHVEVFVSTSAKSLPRTPVYRGKASRYTNKRFKNGSYYRYAVVSYDHTGNASRGSAAVVPPSILLRSPRDGRSVRLPPLLVWTRVSKATFYNVQLYHGAQKVLSAWPNSAKLKLSRNWGFEGRRVRLKKGSYRWYVWPGFGPRSKARYGQLLGQSGFRVR
jgi:hypothetical protein